MGWGGMGRGVMEGVMGVMGRCGMGRGCDGEGVRWGWDGRG